MEIGWIGYNCLQRSQMAPIGAIDQYYTILPDWHSLTGSKMHWMSCKSINGWSDKPSPNAEQDELDAFASCIHYGDGLKPILDWVNDLPSQGRWQSIHERWDELASVLSQCRYEIPYLDVVVVECTGMMGAAYQIDLLMRLLYCKNPNVGYIFYDQDMAASYVWSKFHRWHPAPEERVIFASHHLANTYRCQTVMMTPHLEYRVRPPTLRHRGIAYVGNDYKRREPMLRLMQGDNFYHYGRLKWEFEAYFAQTGVNVMGLIEQTPQFAVEDVYQYYGAGLHLVREDGYRYNYFAARLSEIARAGALAFVDYNFLIGKVLCGDWCRAYYAHEVLDKWAYLLSDEGFWLSLIEYQQWALAHYTGRERYLAAVYCAAERLCEGPLEQWWAWQPYDDLMAKAGLPVWGT